MGYYSIDLFQQLLFTDESLEPDLGRDFSDRDDDVVLHVQNCLEYFNLVEGSLGN